MDARTIDPREDVHPDFGRDVESPGVVVIFEGVECGFQLGILWSCFYADVGLEHSFTVERVASCHTERHLEERMLLVGVQGAVVAHRDGLSGYVLMVAVVSQKSADGEAFGQIIAAFEIHPPSAGLVGEAVADGKVELPVDVGVERVTGLCTAWHGECYGNGHNGQDF